ncbi:unnamed protein product [Phytophthora fragariaefolia]|uniref:Unnamed protein product n=1 Tax=Phytophthora fragariaefolia TaxID=1490495 RepID=A0A9W7CMW3_9STRA|nr:unnamed protein product [Phytophthora fragariaefolia]
MSWPGSASTWGCKTTDHLDYELQHNSMVNSVQVVPYRVFWYPGSPTYSPKRVSFALYELVDDGEIGLPVYESLVFSIVKDMKVRDLAKVWRYSGNGNLMVWLYSDAHVRAAVASLSVPRNPAGESVRPTRGHRPGRRSVDGGEQPASWLLFPRVVDIGWGSSQCRLQCSESLLVLGSSMQYDGGNNARGYEGIPAMDGKLRSRGFAISSNEPHQRFDKQLQSPAAIELEHTIGFSAVPNALHYHPSGRDYVYPAGGSILLTSFQDAHSQLFLRGHEGNVSCIAMSSSGRILASGERGRRADVLVWDYTARRLAFRLSEHDAGIAALGFSDDERLLCSVGVPEDGPRLYIWDVLTGNICATHQKMSNIVTAVVFGGMARDVKRRDTANYQFATVGHRLLQLWVLNPVTGELTQHKIEQTLIRDYTCVKFSPDRETLIAGSSSGDFCVVGVKTRQLFKVVPACSCGVNSILYFDGGVLVGGGDGSVIHYGHDFVDTCHVALDSGIVGMSLNSGQNEIVAGTQAGSIFSVRLALGTSQRSLHATLLSENHSNGVVQIAYASEVSDRFATISRDCTIRVWDASDYSVATRCVVGDAGAPTSLQYSLDILLSGWTDGCIRSHSSDSGEPAWSIDNAHTGGVTALVLSHNQRFIVSAGVSGEVRVWDIRKRDLVSHLKEHSMAVTSLALYRDDLHVISCSRDRSLLCWDLRNERRISSHIQRMGGINTVALSVDQRLVLSAGQEKRISYWDLRIDTPVTVIQKAHDEEATCIAVAHNLEVFATGGNDRLVKLWDFNTNQLIMDGLGHSGNVRGLAFSPDDRQLVSVGDDGCVFVWNLYTEQLS